MQSSVKSLCSDRALTAAALRWSFTTRRRSVFLPDVQHERYTDTPRHLPHGWTVALRTPAVELVEASARTRTWNERWHLLLVAAIFGCVTTIGLPPFVVVGGFVLVAFDIWQRSCFRQPVDASGILPFFLFTVAALDVAVAEEYLTGFAPAMSRLFDVSSTARSFLLIFAFVGPCLYALTAIGLSYRVPLAGFVAWFIFIGPGVPEFTHFIFPFLQPALNPRVTAAITAGVSNGRTVAEMPDADSAHGPLLS